MNTKSFLLTIAAALTLGAGAAAAQHMGHDHGQHGGDAAHAKPAASAGIAEGTVKDGVRIVEIAVTDEGFVPSKVKVKKGERVRLSATRKTDSTCAKEIVIKDHGINQPLPLDKAVKVELTPAKTGEIRYACAMDHVAGVLFVP
jgi:plastocyanin domain-containing protein